MPGTSVEQRAFDMFQKKVASQLSGPFDGWFWKHTLLQASHQEPAIRHALLAVTGLIESLEAKYQETICPRAEECQDAFALHHYTQAIRALLASTQTSQLRIDVCLIVCILFATFEVSKLSHTRHPFQRVS